MELAIPPPFPLPPCCCLAGKYPGCPAEPGHYLSGTWSAWGGPHQRRSHRDRAAARWRTPLRSWRWPSAGGNWYSRWPPGMEGGKKDLKRSGIWLSGDRSVSWCWWNDSPTGTQDWANFPQEITQGTNLYIQIWTPSMQHIISGPCVIQLDFLLLYELPAYSHCYDYFGSQTP